MSNLAAAGEFLSVSDLNNLANSLSLYASNTEYIDLFTAPHIFLAVSDLSYFSRFKMSGDDLEDMVSTLNQVRNRLFT